MSIKIQGLLGKDAMPFLSVAVVTVVRFFITRGGYVRFPELNVQGNSLHKELLLGLC